MTLGDIIRKYRTENGITTRVFAARSGLSSGYISMLEANRNPGTGGNIIPSLKTLNYCAKAMNISLNDLLLSLDDNQKVHLGLDDCPQVPDKSDQHTVGHFAQIQADQNPPRNYIQIAGRDGSFLERELTDDQLRALKAILDQMPDADDDLL